MDIEYREWYYIFNGTRESRSFEKKYLTSSPGICFVIIDAILQYRRTFSRKSKIDTFSPTKQTDENEKKKRIVTKFMKFNKRRPTELENKLKFKVVHFKIIK